MTRLRAPIAIVAFVTPTPNPHGAASADASATPAYHDADAALLADMRDHRHTHAWLAFQRRFRPILEANARRQRIPAHHWPVCIAEVLDDEAMRLSSGVAAQPLDLPAYLVRASQHRYLRLKRAESSRSQAHDAASDPIGDEQVVSSTCSQASLDASSGIDACEQHVARGLVRLVEDLVATLSTDDRLILSWLGECVPHRSIADWLGMSYGACTKRVWRLCRRLRDRAVMIAQEYDGDDRRDVERLMQRVARVARADAKSRRAGATDANGRIPASDASVEKSRG